MFIDKVFENITVKNFKIMLKKLNPIRKMMTSSINKNDFWETNWIKFVLRHFYFNSKKLSESIPEFEENKYFSLIKVSKIYKENHPR